MREHSREGEGFAEMRDEKEML